MKGTVNAGQDPLGVARELGGEGKLDFATDGVVYTLSAPLSRRLALA